MATPHDDTNRRLAALEETAGFTERKADQLDALVAELSAQVFDLTNKLECLDKRLAELKADVQAGDICEVPNDPPPHSHRPL